MIERLEGVLDVRGGLPARQTLAGRVALFGAAWAAVSGFGLASHVAATLLLGRVTELIELPFLVHVLSCVVPLLIWALCRVPRGPAFCRVVEGLGVIASAATLAMMAAMLAESSSAEAARGIDSERAVAVLSAATHKRFALIIVFASCMMLTVRSALVPSHTRLTIGLGVAMGVPIVALPVAMYRVPRGPLYLAPETILAADAVDARSDLYALGAVAYFMLTGETVFGGKSVVEVCSHHLHSRVVPPSERIGEAIPGGLEALVLRCLAKSPDERPRTAKDLENELAALDIEAWTLAEADSWWNAHRRTLGAP